MSALMTMPAGSMSNQTEGTPVCCCDLSTDQGAVARLAVVGQPEPAAFRCPFATPPAKFRRSPHERLTAREERELFGELRRIRLRLAQLGGHDRPIARQDRCEVVRLSCRACSLRRHLGQCYFKLAVSVARTLAARHQDIDDLVGQACLTLMRALDLFDVQRGYRFSTYATRAMRTELSRYIVRRRRRTDRAVDPSVLANQPREAACRQHPGAAAFCALEELLDDLPPREAEVLRARFGLQDRPGSETLQTVATRLGISRERVRQLERSALLKLRRLACEDARADLWEAIE